MCTETFLPETLGFIIIMEIQTIQDFIQDKKKMTFYPNEREKSHSFAVTNFIASHKFLIKQHN